MRYDNPPYHATYGLRIARPTTLPSPPPPLPHAPLLGYPSHAVIDWATKSPSGVVIETLDLDTGRWQVRRGPVDAGETGTDPEHPDVVEPDAVGLARLRGGLLAATPYETRWYPNGTTTSQVIGSGSGALYTTHVLRDASTGNAMVVRGTNPFEVAAVDGMRGVIASRRVVGWATENGAGWQSVAADNGSVYFATFDTNSPVNQRVIRYDLATGRIRWESVNDAQLVSAENGWLVWDDGTLPYPALRLTRADGTACSVRPREVLTSGEGIAGFTMHDNSALMTVGDRGGGGVEYLDLRTLTETGLVNGYYAAAGWFLRSGWAIAYGIRGDNDRTIVAAAPPAPGSTKPARVIVLGRALGIADNPFGMDAGETGG